MRDKIDVVFAAMPEARPLFEMVDRRLQDEFSGVERRISHLQVGYKTRHGFVYVWPPANRAGKSFPVCVILSFNLDRRLESPKITEATQMKRGQWVHHLLIDRPENLDNQVMGWLREAYEFSLR